MKNNIQSKNIELVKILIDSYLLNSRYAKSVEYIESDDSEQRHYLEAVLDCGGYFATITYESVGYTHGKLYMTLAFSTTDYRFRLYDIFNLFNIKDFNCYDFDDCIEDKRITKSVEALENAIEKYSVDIRKANTGSNLARLMKNRKKDMQAMYYDNISNDEYINGEFEYVSRFTKMPREKAISNLSSRVDKGDLTIYERRLLKYLNDGNKLESQSTRGCDFKTARISVYSVIAAASIVVGIIVYFVWQGIIFGGDVYKTYPSGLNNRGLIPDFVYSIVISIIAFYAFMVRLIGRPIVKRITFEKDIARAKFNDKKGVLAVISLFLAVAMSYLANTDCVGFTDSSIIVPEPYGFAEKYEDVTVYRLSYVSDDVGQAFDDSDKAAYIIEYGDGLFYEVALMNVGELEEKDFTNQLKKHRIKIVKVKTEDDIPNYSAKGD